MRPEGQVGVVHVLATLAGVLVAWPVSTVTTVPIGELAAGTGVALGVWVVVSWVATEWLLRRRLHVVVGGSAVVGSLGLLVMQRLGTVSHLDGSPVYPLGVFVCGSLLFSQGTSDLAVVRERNETVQDRVSVSVPRGRRLLRGVILVGVAGVGVRLLVGDPVGWSGVLAGTVSGLLFYDAGDGETELVAVESGLIVVTNGTRRFVPWRFVHPPTRTESSIRLSNLWPYPGVYRRVTDDAADARSFVDTVRRRRRR
jgi:hypothetical protein